VENTLGLEIIEVVEQAAIASSKWMGKGEKNIADQVAVEAMRERMNKIHMRGRIVIGEGERDEAPMLYIGEEVGICTQPNAASLCNVNELVEIDIAVDPCEGTNLVAYGQNGSMAVLAISEKGGLFAAPDFYMKKLAAPAAARGHVDINKSATENLKILSECLNRSVEELVVVVMDRPRHKDLIQEIRTAVIWYKACSVVVPDYHVDYLADNPWIHQPFEHYESINPAELAKKENLGVAE